MIALETSLRSTYLLYSYYWIIIEFSNFGSIIFEIFIFEIYYYFNLNQISIIDNQVLNVYVSNQSRAFEIMIEYFNHINYAFNIKK